MKIDGRTYTKCDCCKKYNIDFDKPATIVEVYNLASFSHDVTTGTGPSWLLCPECAKRFNKVMEEFCNADCLDTSVTK